MSSLLILAVVVLVVQIVLFFLIRSRKKKLEEASGSSKSWARPNEEVKEEVLGKILVPVSAPFAYWKLFLIGASTIAILLTGVYVWNLKNENEELKVKLLQQTAQLENNASEISTINQQHTKEKESLIQENENLRKVNKQNNRQKENLAGAADGIRADMESNASHLKS